MSTYISCESTLPRSNYKKADWTLYSQLTDQVTKDIRVDGRDINKVVNDFNAGILSEELDRLDEESSAARRECETNPSQDNHSHLQHTKARFLRYKLQARRKSWRNKQHHSWRKMVPSYGIWQSNTWSSWPAPIRQSNCKKDLLTIIKK